jgi:WD40 repeat protein
MDGFKLVTHEETGNNPLGLCALSQNPKNEYLTFPSFKPGTIQLVNLRNVNQQRSIAPSTINAHESEIVKLTMDNQATKIATGSIKGTLIRVFDTQTKKMIFELRRGQHFAQLFW